MDNKDEINWQPLGMVPMIGDMVAEALADTREHVLTLMTALDRPYSVADEDLVLRDDLGKRARRSG